MDDRIPHLFFPELSSYLYGRACYQKASTSADEPSHERLKNIITSLLDWYNTVDPKQFDDFLEKYAQTPAAARLRHFQDLFIVRASSQDKVLRFCSSDSEFIREDRETVRGITGLYHAWKNNEEWITE